MPAIDSIEQLEIQNKSAEALDPDSMHLRGFSQTAPQVALTVSPFDGQLDRPALQGQAYYKLARQIRLDPTVRLVRELVMAPLMRAGWQYEAKDDAPPDAVEMIKKQMEPLRLHLLRTSMAGMIDFGYCPYEVWPDGAWNIQVKPLYVDYTTILVNAVDGTFWGLKQQPQYSATGTNNVYLDRQECFIVAQDVEAQNYYGSATLRSLVDIYSEVQAINASSRKYDSKIAGTHWVIYYPLGKSNFNGTEMDNGEIAKAILSKAEAVGGIMVPRSIMQAIDTLSLQAASNEATQWKIELLSDKGQGQMAFENKLKYLDVLKVRAFGVPERAILEGQYGTKAEAETHADIAIANLEVRHQMLCDVYNAELVNKILTWHYGPDSRDSVWLHPSPIDDLSLAFNRQLYIQLLSNPQVQMSELQHIDLDAMRSGLDIPQIEHDESGESDAETDAWLAELGLDNDDLLSELGLSNFDPNQPRDESGQWTRAIDRGNVQPSGKLWLGGHLVDATKENVDRLLSNSRLEDRKKQLAKLIEADSKFQNRRGGYEETNAVREALPLDSRAATFAEAIADQRRLVRDSEEYEADLRLAQKRYEKSISLSGFDPNQQRDKNGKWVKFYHETDKSKIESIKKTGLISPLGYQRPRWYTVTDNLEGAKNYRVDNPDRHIVEFSLTPEQAEEFLWLKAGAKSEHYGGQYALKKPLTPEMISNVFESFNDDMKLSSKSMALAGYDPNQYRGRGGKWAKYPQDFFFTADNGNRYVIQQTGPNTFHVIDSSDMPVGTEYASLDEAKQVAEAHSNPQPPQPITSAEQPGEGWRATAQTAEYYGSTITQSPDGQFEVITANGNVYWRATLDEAIGVADQHLRGVAPNDPERLQQARQVYQKMRGDEASQPETQPGDYRGYNIRPSNSSNGFIYTDPSGFGRFAATEREARQMVDWHVDAQGNQPASSQAPTTQQPSITPYRDHTIERNQSTGMYDVISSQGHTVSSNASLASAQHAVDLRVSASEAARRRESTSNRGLNPNSSVTHRGHTIIADEMGNIRIATPEGQILYSNSLEAAQRGIDARIRAGESSEESTSSTFEPESKGDRKFKLGDKELTLDGESDLTTKDARKINPKFTLKRIVSMVGPQNGAEIKVSYHEGRNVATVTVKHPDYDAARTIYSDHIHNDTFFKKRGSASGLSVQVVHDQVAAAVKSGMKYLELFAGGQGSGSHTGSSGSMNGYYTWPRMGYDAKLHPKGSYNEELESHIEKTKAVNVSDLMKTELGRYLWKKHGKSMDMRFDLSKGSLSRRMLSKYYKETKKKGKE